MLIALCSCKGAPGVTSSALAIAASWPRPVVLVEADPSGGDLMYRCTHASGGSLAAAPGIVQLATAARNAPEGRPGVLAAATQPLACGVPVVQGVAHRGQSRGLAGLWSAIARTAANDVDVDVIVDLGRIEDATMPLVEASQWTLVVAQPLLDSVMHLRDVVGQVVPRAGGAVAPLLVGRSEHAGANGDDLDAVLADVGAGCGPTLGLAWDPKALWALEKGRITKSVTRSPLMRSAYRVADQLAAETREGATA